MPESQNRSGSVADMTSDSEDGLFCKDHDDADIESTMGADNKDEGQERMEDDGRAEQDLEAEANDKKRAHALEMKLNETHVVNTGKRRRPPPKGTTTETPAPIKKKRKQLTQADWELMYPRVDPRTYPPESERKTIPEVLKVAKVRTGEPAAPGVARSMPAYIKRHYLAPYAYDYRGRLAREYWPYRYAKDRKGIQILTEDEIKHVCPGLNPGHERLPYPLNANGDVYKKLPSFIKPARNANGTFAMATEAKAVISEKGLTAALATAILGQNSVVDIKKAVSAKQLGKQKLDKTFDKAVTLAADATLKAHMAIDAMGQQTKLINDEVRKRTAVLTTKLNTALDRIAELEEDNVRLQLEKDDLLDQMADLEEELQDAGNRQNATLTKYLTLQQEIGALKARVAHLEAKTDQDVTMDESTLVLTECPSSDHLTAMELDYANEETMED